MPAPEISPSPGIGPVQEAAQLVIRGGMGFRDLVHVENEAGVPLADGVRSMEGWAGMMEMIMVDPAGRFLLAFRQTNPPGHPVIQAGIHYLAVDDQGQPVGELRRRSQGLGERSYELWNQGAPFMTVPPPSRSEPYLLLQQGAPVATITMTKPFLGKPMEATWTVRFTSACPHLPALALATYVALSHGISTL